MIASIIFIVALGAAVFLFARKIQEIRRNINLGRDLDRSDRSSERWSTMIRVALGQSKMTKKPIAGALHIVVYVGFLIINIEVLEMIIDGVTGSHRALSFLGGGYTFLIATFEVLALLTFVACAIFLVRRNVIKVKRLVSREMTAWPKTDANLILFTELVLMSAFLFMNASDSILMGSTMEALQGADLAKYGGHDISVAAFPVSSLLVEMMPSDLSTLFMIERGTWWLHILGILAFLNYLPYSKHFHIILAFPNVYYSNLDAKGGFTNMEAVTNEVKLMLDPSADPYATPAPDAAPPARFGAKDVTDLTWKQLMDSYSCTECGRCTDQCPANQTGKLLSPRAIMMSTRDRLEEVGKGCKGNEVVDDGKSLFDYIKPEEIWACTSCNACVDACPVNIDPLSIIIDLRRFVVMEESGANAELNGMFTNIENNGAPWQFAQSDRLNWATED